MESRWEDVDPQLANRPARRYYRITSSGLELVRAALARAYVVRGTSTNPVPVRDLP